MIPSSFLLIFEKYTNLASNTANKSEKGQEHFFQQNNDFNKKIHKKSYFNKFFGHCWVKKGPVDRTTGIPSSSRIIF